MPFGHRPLGVLTFKAVATILRRRQHRKTAQRRKGLFTIKICGITTEHDASVVVSAGADALGLNFYASSPRCISLPMASAIARAAPENVAKVGVFVNMAVSDVADIASEVGLSHVQLHVLQAVREEKSASLWQRIQKRQTRRRTWKQNHHVDNLRAVLLVLPGSESRTSPSMSLGLSRTGSHFVRLRLQPSTRIGDAQQTC